MDLRILAFAGAAVALGWLAPNGDTGDLFVSVGLLVGLVARIRWLPGTASAVALALAAWIHFVGPSVLGWTRGDFRVWNLFHYTIGSKFFGELGYHDLYLGTLAADRGGDDSLAPVKRLRDLRTYETVTRAEVERAYVVEDHFPPERLADLRRTVDALEGLVAPRLWRDVFMDRGYNATPAYTAIAGRVATALPVGDPVARRASTTLDMVMLLGGLAALWAVFGAEATALVVLILAMFPGVEDRLVGGFLEYDWLAALLVAAAAVRAERPGAAGIALAWATASRLFPGALAVSLLVPAVVRRVRGEALPAFERRFAVVFAGAGAGFVLLGCATARGPAAWLEFLPRFALHASHHVFGNQRVGLRHLLTLGAADSEAARLAMVEARTPIWIACAAVGFLLWAFAASRRSRDEALQLGWIPVFLLAVSSRYYWAGAVGVAVVPGRWVAVGAAAVCAVGHAARWADAGDYGTWLALEAALAVGLAGWAVSAGRTLEGRVGATPS